MSTVFKPKFTHVPQHVLRRLADRALKVIARHAPAHAAIQTFADPFVPIAREFIDAYEQAQRLGESRAQSVPRAHAAIEALRCTVQAWAPHLRRDRVRCSLGAFTIAAATPSELLADGQRVVTELTNRFELNPQPSYLKSCVHEISKALEDAQVQWRRSQVLATSHLEALRDLRPMSTDLQQHLVGLRRTLRAVLGRNHPDHQKVRLERALRYDEEDTEVLAGSAAPGDPIESAQGSRRPNGPERMRPLPARGESPERTRLVG